MVGALLASACTTEPADQLVATVVDGTEDGSLRVPQDVDAFQIRVSTVEQSGESRSDRIRFEEVYPLAPTSPTSRDGFELPQSLAIVPAEEGSTGTVRVDVYGLRDGAVQQRMVRIAAFGVGRVDLPPFPLTPLCFDVVCPPGQTCEADGECHSARVGGGDGGVSSDAGPPPDAGPPADAGPPPDAPVITYAWQTDGWSDCDRGTRTREVFCEGSDGTRVEDARCTDPRPDDRDDCGSVEDLGRPGCTPDDATILREHDEGDCADQRTCSGCDEWTPGQCEDWCLEQVRDLERDILCELTSCGTRCIATPVYDINTSCGPHFMFRGYYGD